LDYEQGISKLFVADATWCTAGALQELVTQTLKSKWRGWGARVSVLPIKNILSNVAASVVLKNNQFLNDVADINENIRKVVKAYFDDRPDFYSWKLRALRGAIARADSRILTCTAAQVLDADGSPMAEPSALSGASTYAAHYFLTDDAISTTFTVAN
jgi:hypothetical protein